ncbi:POU domain transcription factor class 4 [Clonorchis sinensis]|uniref:POU domain protein n=1 Tax=Clonorchis sinensis TaxID=79923 RepID=H2KUR2_CLOSI|nr:POU domain transcription factor class 4 [Clonorchis sinensis]
MITSNSLPYRAETVETYHPQYPYYTDSPGTGPFTSDSNETLRFGSFSSGNLSAETFYFENIRKRPNTEESVPYLTGVKSTDLPKYATRLPEQSISVLIKEQQCLQKEEGQCPVLMEGHGNALHRKQPKTNFGNALHLNRPEVDSHNAELSTNNWTEAVAKHESKITCAPNSAQAYDNLRRSFGLLSAFTQLLMPSSEHPTSKVSSRCESPSVNTSNDNRAGPGESCVDLLSQNLSRYLCDTLLTRQCETTLNDSTIHTNRSLTPDQVTATLYSSAHEIDELKAFASKFKQRRMKLGVTQAEVGRALGCLQIGGFGCLSQSTICRFESLTLSHNNMLVLKPILEEWLDIVEREHEQRQLTRTIGQDDIVESEYYSEEMRFYGTDRRRRRTSITDPEKHLLEAYFQTQPKPSTDELALIADRIKLRKNVVRVWFCNQRQKQKRLHTKQKMCDMTNQRNINRH